jgi:DNA-binding NarL/FixJ family response regulator
LTKRETEFVELLCLGKTVEVVAELMDISPGTAATYKANAFRKLNITKVIQLPAEAIRLGIVPCPCPDHAGQQEGSVAA